MSTHFKRSTSFSAGDKEPYLSLSAYFRGHFGGKVRKVPLDAGFTCPNRRGAERSGGCSWCDPSGSGPGGDTLEWKEKLRSKALELSGRGYKGVVAYFQAYSNTFAEASKLEEMYRSALGIPGVLGLAVGTRPDCLGEKALELLGELGRTHFLWVEIGMQSKHDPTLNFCNRGHLHEETVGAVGALKARGIKTVLHLIAGLPCETEEMMIESFEEAARLRPWGAKLHPLHIVRGSELEKWHRDGKVDLLSLGEYASLAASFVETMPKGTVIHRITGERPEEMLIAPKWCLDKNAVRAEILKAIETRLARRESPA